MCIRDSTTLSLHGNVRFRGKAAEAMLDSVALAIGARAWRNTGPVEARLEGDRLDVTRFSLAADAGRIELAGHVELQKSVVEARALLQQVDLGRVVEKPDALNAARGIADGDLLISG